MNNGQMVLAAYNKLGVSAITLICLAPCLFADEAQKAITKLPWHLEDCAQTEACMNIAPVWERFSQGDPATTVLVLENKLHRDSRSAVYGHAGLAALNVEFVSVKDDIAFAIPADGVDKIEKNVRRIEEVAKARFGKAARQLSADPTARDGFCTFVSSGMAVARNHDLHMAALIGGQPLPGVSGVAPNVRLTLHNGSIGRDIETNRESNELARIIPHRPDIRVINVSQGDSDLTEPHWAHYQRLREFAMRVGARATSSPNDPRSRILVVAAAGNRPRIHSFSFKVNASLDYRIPREAIHTNRSVQSESVIDLSPHIPSPYAGVAAPLLVVGAVQFDRDFPSFGRFDPGIDVLAPSGATWARESSEENKAKSSTSADWRDCVCAFVRQQQLGEFERNVSELQECKVLNHKRNLDRLLGIPVIDYHARSGTSGAETENQTLCRDEPAGACRTAISGTSGAAALVSGVAALMFSLDPSLTGEEAARLLKSSAINSSKDGLPVVNPMAAMHAVQGRMINRVFAAFSRADFKWLDQNMAKSVHVEDLARKFTSSPERDRVLLDLLDTYGRSSWRYVRLDDAVLVECDHGALILPRAIGLELAKDRPCAPRQTRGNTLFQRAMITDGTDLRSARFIWTRDFAPNARWILAGLRFGELDNAQN